MRTAVVAATEEAEMVVRDLDRTGMAEAETATAMTTVAATAMTTVVEAAAMTVVRVSHTDENVLT